MSANSRHYSASELAGVHGMPKTRRGVLMKASTEQWPSRPRAGRGGGKEYPLAALPAVTRAHLAAQITSESANAGRLEGAKLQLSDNISTQANHNRHLESLKAAVTTPVNGQRRIDAKLQLLSLWEQFNKTAALPIMASLHRFAELYNHGKIEVEAWVRDELVDISGGSIHRWRMAIKRDGVAQLAGRYGNRKGESIIETQPALAEFAIGMLVRYPHSGSAHLMQAIRARFGKEGDAKLPSPRALQRWMGKWKSENKQTYMALTNPDAWKNKFMSAFGSQSADVERVNQRWELDSTPGDVMLTDGRHVVIGVIDLYSRRMRLLVSKTSKATAIATLLRHTIIDWGVPEQAKTDGGSDYVSNHIQRVFRDLDIESIICPPFQPWHKPHIERGLGTFSHDLVELLAGFIGHNVAERKAIEARSSFADRLMKRGGTLEVSLSSVEFQKFCDEWCENVYLHRAHEGLKGKTPFEVASSSRDPIRAIEDVRALDILLAEAPANNGLRTVQKKGIELDQAWFIAPALEAHIGNQVHVRFDPVDLGRLYVFDLEEGFICVAECPERTGMDRKLVASKSREMQKARVQDERRLLKAAAKRANTDDIVHEILLDKAEAAGKLTRLPAPSTAHDSTGLQAAAAAVRSRRAPKPDPVPEEAMRALEQDMAGGKRRKVVAIDDPIVNYRRWMAIGERINNGETVAEGDLEWHRAYGDSDELRSTQRFVSNFGDAAVARA